MKLIIGLGNPGKEYANTRHNAGFIILDQISHTFGFPPFKMQEKLGAEISKKTLHGEEIILAKPQTFMNRSGEATQKIMNYYKIPIADIAVIHDDLDIPLGSFKISPNSSAAGHNGIVNIIAHLGTQQFKRIRIGIEGAEKKLQRSMSGSDFVMQQFSSEELQTIKDLSSSIEKEII